MVNHEGFFPSRNAFVYSCAPAEVKGNISLLDEEGGAGSGAGIFGVHVEMVDEGMCWRSLGSCIDQLGFGALVLVGKGDVLDQGVCSKVSESIGTFLCQCCAEKEQAICGLDALISSCVQQQQYPEFS